MSTPQSADVLHALRDFVARLDELDPEASDAGELTVGFGGVTERLRLRVPVARALTEALRGYHDPRERGTCAHCGDGRLDDDFVCRSCGIVNGLFGQTLAAFVNPAPPASAVDGERQLGSRVPGQSRHQHPGPRGIARAGGPDGTLGD